MIIAKDPLRKAMEMVLAAYVHPMEGGKVVKTAGVIQLIKVLQEAIHGKKKH